MLHTAAEVAFEFTVDPSLDGHENMRRDSALLDRAEEGVASCRVYSWTGPWVSLGRFQNATRDLMDPDLIPWVMRPTGGKAVLHGHDITVGLAMPLDLVPASEGPRSLQRAYRFAIRPLVEALRACGVPAAMGEDTSFIRSGLSSADCFVGNSPNDVVHEQTGLKVCGCALRFTRQALLLQASIPIGPPLVEPALLFQEPHRDSPGNWQDERFAEALQQSLAAAVHTTVVGT
jgi:lipoate-protein ligase A